MLRRVAGQSFSAITIGAGGDFLIQSLEQHWESERAASKTTSANPASPTDTSRRDTSPTTPQPASASRSGSRGGEVADGGARSAEQPGDFDLARTGRVCAYRMVHAPVVDACFRQFDARVLSWGVVGARAVVAKVALDQTFLLAPTTTAFFMSQSLMEGKTVAEGWQRISTQALPTMAAGAPFWCTTHLVTFGLVPVPYRVVWVQTAAVVWVAYMSWMNQQSRLREEAHESEQAGATRSTRPP